MRLKGISGIGEEVFISVSFCLRNGSNKREWKAKQQPHPPTKGDFTLNNDNPKPTTNDAGIPVSSDEYSLTVGPNGPILLQDYYLIEQMANFNREKIPERQPHAKGSGAFGYFEVTKDVSAYTKAAVFQPGTKTDTLIRFSTVAGEQGSPDTWRDPRGFALKFYTSEGSLRYGWKQHSCIFRSRSDEVPTLHPLSKTARRQWPARQ